VQIINLLFVVVIFLKYVEHDYAVSKDAECTLKYGNFAPVRLLECGIT